MPFVTPERLIRIKREAYEHGHYDGCVKAHNNALATVNNALDCGQRPSRRMRARLHDTTVDRVATIVDRRERAAVQRAVNIAAKRVARDKRIRVRVNGVVIRPKRAATVR